MEMKKHRITVGLCAYNAARTIQEAIDSILNQSASWHELIVLDDGSTDETLTFATKIAKKYTSRIRIIQQENRGIGEARNRILAEAQGEWLAYIDADDVWHPLKLARQMACISTQSRWGALVTRAWSWKDGGNPMESASFDFDSTPIATPYPKLEHQLLIKNFDFHPASVLWRTELLRNFGGYSTDRNGEDFAPFLNMALAQIPIGLLDERLYGGRISEGSLTHHSTNHYRGAIARLKAVDAALSRNMDGKGQLSKENLKLLHQGRQRFLRWAIYGVRKGYLPRDRRALAYPLLMEIQPIHSRWWEWLKLYLG